MGIATIFIPGIQGTKLVETNKVNWDTVWSGIQKEFESIEDLELTNNFYGERFDHKLDSILKPADIEELAYHEFLKDLKTEDPIYIFNYDWRQSNRTTAEVLSQFVEYIRKKSQAIGKPITSFNFITHSMGNYVVRAYIKRYGFEYVNKIAFTVPPFLGSLCIAQVVVMGQGFFKNTRTKIRKMIRSLPGALELLAHYNKAGLFHAEDKKVDFFNALHWQKNITRPENRTAPKFLNALEEAKKTVIEGHFQNLSQLTEEQRKRILIIMRTGYKTLQSMYVHKSSSDQPGNYFNLDDACITEDGDGSVPDISAACYADSINTICIKDHIFYNDYSHGFFLKDERVQRLVNRFLYRDTFNTSTPGNSIYTVKGIKEATNKMGLPYWELILK